MRLSITIEDESLTTSEVLQKIQDILNLPQQVRELKEQMMADDAQLTQALTSMQQVVNTGFTMLGQHVEAEKQQVLDAIQAARDAAGGGDTAQAQTMLDNAAAAVNAFSTSLQEKFAEVATSVDNTIP